jgi:hypothetical protein
VACNLSEQAFFLFLLTLDAVPRPWDGVQPLALDVLLALHAEAVCTFVGALKGFLDKLKNAPVIVALMKEKFLGVRIRSTVGKVLGDFKVRFAAVLLGPRHHASDFFLLC